MENKYFKVAGNLEEPLNNNFNQELFIKKYLLKLTSKENVELKNINIVGSGSMIISFMDLQEMEEEGCYIFNKAEYLNPEMIIVEFQKYETEKNIKK